MARATVAAAVGLAAGALFDQAWLGAFVALAAVLLRRFYFAAALRAWVDAPKRVELPEPSGIWGEIYERLLDRQRRTRQRKRRLAALLAQFQASAEALPDGAVVMEERGEIAWFNTAARALLGLRAPQDVGQRLPNLLRHPAFAEQFERADFEGELELPSPVNSAITLSLRVVPYGANQRLLLVRDVSERHRLERVRRDFVANASHELRTPLTVLRGYLEMMLPETERGLGEWRVPVAEMHAQAARMEALVRDLLKLARLEAETAVARQDVVDVAKLVEQALADARLMSKGEHIIEADVDAALRLYGRETEAESVFANLIANAVQYTPAGGRITVRWRATADGSAEFSVADTGIGIAPEDVPRLTERFFRVDEGRSRASGGTGLGLSIVKHALERHEGLLEIGSVPDAGSTFTCRFPPHRVVRASAPAGA